MITLTFNTDDLANLRFAHSPFIEMVMSYHILYQPDYPAIYDTWVAEVRQAICDMRFPFMAAVILPHRGTADFLLAPCVFEKQVDEALANLRETSEDDLRRSIQQILMVVPLTPEREMFLYEPRQALDCLIDELRLYWQVALAPHWTRIAALIETELLNRGRSLALSGPEQILSQLANNTTYDQGVLRIDKRPAAWMAAEHTLKGSGALLVPLMFKYQSSFHTMPTAQPMLIYSAAGAGLWQSAPQLEVGDSLRVLLGDSKARLIITLSGAHYNTGELAHRLNLTSGAVSQQLHQLYDTGVVEMHRVGKHVFYRLSSRGESLLKLFKD